MDMLEVTIDKFTFRVANDRFYSSTGVWVLLVNSEGLCRVRVGLTDYLQQHSGDMAFVTVRPVGTQLTAGEELADLETIKVTMGLPSPVSGQVVLVNEELEFNAEVVNQSPYEKGWLAEMEVADWQMQRASLLNAKDYFELMKSQAEDEVK